LAADLRQNLISAGLDTSAIIKPGSSSHGTITRERAVDPSLLNVVLISLTGANGLRAFVKAIEVFMKSRICSLTIRTSDGTVYDYDGPLSAQQREILVQFLAAQETRDKPAAPSAS
jgi:hypothetical protein